MKILYSRGRMSALKGTVLTVGIFDGVHRGHRAVIGKVARRARRLGLTSVVVTFDPHPSKVLRSSGKGAGTLISLDHRVRLIREMGIDAVVVVRFTKEVAAYEPHEFAGRFLAEKMRAREVIVGGDFHFGRSRQGDRRLLRFLGSVFGFRVDFVKAVRVGGRVVSSSRIRSLIRRGGLRRASAMLGRPVSVLGTVVHGAKIAATLGYPTANIDPHHEVVPPSGVYAVKVICGKKVYGGVVNIGFRPTIPRGRHRPPHAKRRLADESGVEVHIFDCRQKRLYGKDLEILFLRRLRPERRFGSRTALVAQIGKDVRQARLSVRRMNAGGQARRILR